jgi:hypothetical protein
LLLALRDASDLSSIKGQSGDLLRSPIQGLLTRCGDAQMKG